MKNERKKKAIELLKQNVPPAQVAEETGYSLRRIYDFKKELENQAEENESQPETAIAMQSDQPPAEINTKIKETLEKALETLLQHLEQDVTTDTIEGIVKITELYNSLQSPIYNIAEMLTNEPTTNEDRTPIHEEPNGEQDTPTTSPDANNFVEILEKTSGRTDETN